MSIIAPANHAFETSLVVTSSERAPTAGSADMAGRGTLAFSTGNALAATVLWLWDTLKSNTPTYAVSIIDHPATPGTVQVSTKSFYRRWSAS